MACDCASTKVHRDAHLGCALNSHASLETYHRPCLATEQTKQTNKAFLGVPAELQYVNP